MKVILKHGKKTMTTIPAPDNDTLTRVPGLRVGHAHDLDAITGCTVILCPPGTVAGVDQRGGAPGTRETDLLRPGQLVQHVHAILLAGGSAYGLAAADGVMRYLEENGIGHPTQAGVVPIVPAAILYDLHIGRADRRPDAAMGYAACQAASADPVVQGSVGAGTGAMIGGGMGVPMATKGGIGSAAQDLGGGLYVAALMAVNALGDVVDETGQIMAGLRAGPGSPHFVGMLNAMRMMRSLPNTPPDTNTVIGVVATNAKLDKAGANRVASMAQNGLAQAIRPAHTLYDGDTIFALATGEIEADMNTLNLIGAYAAEVTARAIRAAVRSAVSLGGAQAGLGGV
jgi:L-aminopeptidase/D-esterase-like protein